MNRGLLALGLAASLGWSAAAGAHPHECIDQTVTLTLTPKGVAEIELTWAMDRFFSEFNRPFIDRDKDGRLSAAEVDRWKRRVQPQLEEMKFMAYFEADGKLIEPSKADGFDVRLIEGRLVYDLRFRLAAPARALEVTVFDEGYYVDITPPHGNPVSARGEGPPLACVMDEHKTRRAEWGSFRIPPVTYRCQVQDGPVRAASVTTTLRFKPESCEQKFSGPPPEDAPPPAGRK